MKTYDYKLVEFLSTNNTIAIENLSEFVQFIELTKNLGLYGAFYNIHKEYKNGWLKCPFYIEYNNGKGATFYKNKQESINWYGCDPINIKELVNELSGAL